jgi:hypothetical protein
MASGIFKGLGDKMSAATPSTNMLGDEQIVVVGQVLYVITGDMIDQAIGTDPLAAQYHNAIIFKAHEIDDRKSEESIRRIAFPLDRGDFRLPIPGELVEIFVCYTKSTATKAFFYRNVISNTGVVQNASLPYVITGPNDVRTTNKLTGFLTNNTEELADRFEKRFIHNPESIKQNTSVTNLREGDKLLEGRFGGSIKFTSTIKMNGVWSNTQLKQEAGKPIGEEGDPFIVIKNTRKQDKPDTIQVLDDNVDEDQSMIYVNTSQVIPVAIKSSTKMLSWDVKSVVGGLGLVDDEQALLNQFMESFGRYDPTQQVTGLTETNLNQQSYTGTFSGENAFVEGTGGYPPNPKDADFAAKYTNGIMPAVIYKGDNSYVVETYPADRSDLTNRHWFVVNNSFTKNLAPVTVPLKNNKTVTVRVMPEFANILSKAFAIIATSPLREYMVNCGGGFAVRNVTGGTRLTNHAWGFAIDINSDVYEYGYRGFRNGASIDNPAYPGHAAKHREIANIIVAAGAQWLENSDPHHFSIHE